MYHNFKYVSKRLNFDLLSPQKKFLKSGGNEANVRLSDF